VVSIVNGVLAKGKETELEDLGCAETERETLACSADQKPIADDLADDGETLAIASTVTTFVGGALIASGVILIVLGADEPAEPTAAFIPVVGPDGAGLFVRGSF
jgi:hypothetical protein